MRGVAVALVGPDGAGKSTVTEEVVRRLGPGAVRIYMGVNLESANFALPTTRLLLALKRRRGGRPDLTGWHADDSKVSARPTARDVARVLNLIAEEWYRAAIVAYHKRRGRMVVMDRHFIADYWRHDIAPPDPSARPWISRVHGHLLGRWYPRPEHVIFLDAPPDILHGRKPETPTDYLVGRRSEYVDFGRAVGELTTISSDQPLEQVIRQCVAVVQKTAESHSV